MTPLPWVLGATRSIQITGTSGGVPITGVYGSGDTLAATLWAGDDRAPILSPTVAWILPTACTIRFTITASQLTSANLKPGEYHAELVVTPTSDSQPRSVWLGRIQFTAAAGAASAPTSYVSFEQALIYCPQLPDVLDATNDQARFDTQLQSAKLETDRRILNRYRPVYGRQRSDLSQDGSAAGAFRQYATTSQTVPTRAALAAFLTARFLILDEPLTEFNARWAAAEIYGAQVGRGSPYAEMAKLQRGLAEEAWAKAVVEIATGGGTVPDIRIDRDVTFLGPATFAGSGAPSVAGLTSAGAGTKA